MKTQADKKWSEIEKRRENIEAEKNKNNRFGVVW